MGPLQSGLGSNGNEGLLYIPQSFRTGSPTADDLVSDLSHTHIYMNIYIYIEREREVG